jgi:hypothetical protein
MRAAKGLANMTIQEQVLQTLYSESSEAYKNFILLRHRDPDLSWQWLNYAISVDDYARTIEGLNRALQVSQNTTGAVQRDPQRASQQALL